MTQSTVKSYQLSTGLSTNDTYYLVDNLINQPTPEGLTLSLIPAGMMPRLSAWLIDFLIRIVLFAVIAISFNMIFGGVSVGLNSILFFVVSWLYPIFFEVFSSGMTPGKKRKGIYVCHDDGTPINLQSSAIRNLLRVADFLPFLFMGAIISMLFNTKHQRLGDIFAGTIVVYKNNDDIDKIFNSIFNKTNIDNDEEQNNSNLMHQALPLFSFPLTFNEQQAILNFSDRYQFIPLERKKEICQHLDALCHGEQTGLDNTHNYEAVIFKANSIKGVHQDA